MARLSIFTLSFFLFILSFFSTFSLAIDVPEIELLPLNKHGETTSFKKRMEDPGDGYGGLDLQNFGIFLWGAQATSTMMIANLTLDFSQDYEAIVDMDDFAGLVKSIDCSAPDLYLEFKDEKSFAYAHQVWDWVNSDDNFTFVLIASAEACAPESRRQPFLVSDLDFDEVNNKVLMKAVLKTWEDIAVTYSFKITNEPLPPGSPALAKRDGKTLSLAHDFSQQLFDVNTKGLDIGVSCSPCGIEGSVNVDLDLETFMKVPVGASMKITPRNIAAAIELSLHLDGKLASAYSPGDVNVVSVPLTGFNVGGFFKLGVFLTVDLGFEIDEWTGTAQASMGARMSIPNTSTLKVNLFGKGDNDISGWVPEFSKIPPSLSAKVEGSAEAYAQAGIEVTAKGLSNGFSVGLDMKMPYIRADFSALADSKGVCGTKKTLGVDLQADVGAELYASASLDDDSPFWTHTLFDKTLGTLIDKCYPFGPDNAATGGGEGKPPPRKTKKPKSKTKKATSKKPSAHPKTSAPEETLKPVTPTSKKRRPTNPKLTTPTKTKSTKPPETTNTPRPTDKSSHTSNASKSSSKHSVSKGGSSAAESSHSGSHSLPVSSKPTVTEVTITTSTIVPSKSDTASADSTRPSSGSLPLSSGSVSSSGVRFSNVSSTHVATSKPASGTPRSNATASSSGESDSPRSSDQPKTTTKPLTMNEPTTTKESSTISTLFTTTTTASDEEEPCILERDSPAKNAKRATTRKRCNSAQDTLRITSITKSVPVLKTFTETCSVAKAGQACYHYYSVIDNNSDRGWDHFTCSDSQERHDGYATQIWENQHPKNAWRDYLPVAMTSANGVVKCQRDEYPPAYFMPADTTANKQNKNPQIIRWLPEADNNAGGKIWTQFCANRDGGKGNGQLKRRKKDDKVDVINEDLVDLQPNPNEKSVKGNDGKTTTITYYEAKYTRAVFELGFDWDGKPKPNATNDWFLSENPCWPKAIATSDPGYNLLTDDNWYTTAGSPQQQTSRAQQKVLYAKDPPANYVSGAIKPNKRARRGGLLSEREFEILDDGFGVRSANISRRLADGEIEIIQCMSADCTNEKRMLSEDEIAAIIPAVIEKKGMMPERNDNVVPTAVPEKRWAQPAGKRLGVSLEPPVVTAGW